MNYPILIFSLLLFVRSGFSQDEAPYFQQQVNYDIEVELNDKKHELIGHETVTYINNSPKTIHSIYFHLWPNAYKDYKTALCRQKLEENDTKLYHAPDSVLGYIDGFEFKVNGERLEWNYYGDYEDVCIVFLLDPLKPGEQVEITTPFKVKIPKGVFSRLGHIGQSYQITQWYPKPAVYDRDGWHPMPYLDQGEFYSEYGTFDVKITLPKNYVVGATGDLVNGEEELAWLAEKVKATEQGFSDKTIPQQLKDDATVDMSFPESSAFKKTLHFHQEKVHDFAWFADKRYHVLKGEVKLPHTGRTITTWAMFTNNEAELWQKSIDYINDATYYYSLWNGDYPYNHVTAVDGSISAGGGMEYPNITVIGESYDDFGLETVIMHEVGHNWFYGILGSNERDHPWMDEGLNSMNENRYIETKYPNRSLIGSTSKEAIGLAKKFDLAQYKHKASYELAYLMNASRNLDQPIEYESAKYSSFNYGGIVYAKTAIVFDYLMAYLGEEVYDRSMQRYFNEWKFKHPGPDDLRAIFEQEAGKDLSWFFNDVLKTTKTIDYKIVRAKKDTADETKVQLKVVNKGIEGPFSISGVDKSGNILTTHWYEPIDKKGYVSFPKGEYDAYRIDAQLDIPELKRKNNTLKTHGLFKKTEPFRLQAFGSIENPDKTQLFFTPIAGWSMNDKAMFGLAFYNSTIPFKQFEYVVAPMYAINSGNLNGYASAYYHIMPNDVFQDIALGVSTSSFSFLRAPSNQHPKGREILEYYKINPNIEFTFKKKRARQFSQLYARIENMTIFEEQQVFEQTKYNVDLGNFYVNRLTLGIQNHHPINPFNASVIVEQAEDFVKLNLEANYYFAYRKKGTGLSIRMFIGTFLYNDDAANKFNYYLSGNGDYTYDHILLARGIHKTFLTQQAIINDGGFKNLAIAETDKGFVASGNKWIRAVNLKSNLFTRAISVYGDFAILGYSTVDFANNEIDGATKPAYNFGLSLNVVPSIFEIYFPIAMSSEFNELNYGEKIRFTLNINQLNPFKFARKFDL